MSDIPALPKGFVLDAPKVPPPPAGFVVDSQNSPAVPPPPPGFVLDNAGTQGETSPVQPVVNSGSAVPGTTDVALGTRLATAAKDAAALTLKANPITGPFIVGKEAAQLAGDIGKTDTPEQAAQREAIRQAGNLPDNSSATGDLINSYTSSPGSMGTDALRYTRMVRDKRHSAEDATLATSLRDTVIKGIADQARTPSQPVNPVAAELSKQNQGQDVATTLQNYGTALATDPWGVARTVGLTSTFQSWKSIAGGFLGSAIAGSPGAAVGAGLGSYDTELNSRIVDGIAKYGGDVRDEKSILATLDKHGDKIESEARTGAATVAFFDAMSGIAAVRIAKAPMEGITNSLVRGGVKTVAGSAADAGLGSLGEAGAQLAVDGKVSNWDSVFQEAMGSVVGGAVMETGMMAIEKLGSKIKLGKPATEDELANAWRQSVGDEPISTYTEAVNSGKTNFAFVKDGETASPVGSYREAEARAGREGFRNGRLIAVDDASITNQPKPITEAMMASVKRLAQIPFTQLPYDTMVDARIEMEAALGSMAAKDAFWNKIVATRQEPDIAKRTAAVEAIVQSDVQPLLPQQKIYVGDGFGSRITPKLDNYVLMGNFSYDLDKAQELAASQGKVVVPTARLDEISGTPGYAELIDQTFNFASPEVRAKFLHYGALARGDMMAKGKVSWKGRLDPRFFQSGQYSNEEFLSVTPNSMGATGASDVAKMPVSDVHSFRRSRDEKFYPSVIGFGKAFPNSSLSQDIRNKLKADKATPDKIWRHVGESPTSAKFADIINSWLKKFKVNTNTLLIHIPVDANYNWLLSPDELVAKIQATTGLSADTVQEIMSGISQTGMDKGGHQAFHWTLSYDLSVLCFHDHVSGTHPLGLFKQMEVYAHEFGHLLSFTKLVSAPLETLLQVLAAHRRFREAFDRDRSNWETRAKTAWSQGTELNQPYHYVSKFEEWWAHQFTKWAMEKGPALGPITRLARQHGKAIIEFLTKAKGQKFDTLPEPEVASFLNSMKDGTATTFYADTLLTQVDDTIKKANAKALQTPYQQATPAYENLSAPLRQINASVFGNLPFKSAKVKAAQKNLNAASAMVDRFGWIYKWAANLRQLSEANPHIQELQIARELFGQVKIDTAKIHVAADAILQKWRQLGEKRGRALSQFLFNLDQMTYRTSDEIKNGVLRWPTKDEFTQMAKDLELDSEAIQVYGEVRDFFLNSVRRIEELRLVDASRIVDPATRDAAIKSAKLDSIQLIKKPYFPQTRFGKFSVTVRTLDGKMEGFWLFETEREAKQVANDMMRNEFPKDQFKTVLSTLPEEIAPFVGMSPWMLDKVREMPGLSQQQLDWIDQLRYQMAPSQSFVKHMMKRKNIIGASEDGRRVFANYAFHHGRNYARTKYGSSFRDVIGSLRKSLPPGYEAPEVSKRNAMADMVQHQVNELMNPSRDWAHLRSLNALWHLGFNVKSAVVNTTQIFATTAFLGAKFGGLRAEKAMLEASSKMSTYYRKGEWEKLGQSDSEFRALDRAIKDGHIDESMAAELAAVAIGGGVGQRMGKSLLGDKFTTSYLAFTEKAMWMQRMTDQWQRRLTFRAAWQLAMENPNNKWVNELRVKYPTQFEQLTRNESWSEREALAYLAGLDSSTQTQGTYDRQARPRYMQGRKSVLFAFQLFSQQNVWMLANNKDMWFRYSLYMLAIGGIYGLVPDDLENVFELVGKMAFGKDFDLKRGAREFIVDMMSDKIPPDLILHGAARYGFGAHAIGEMAHAPFIPEVDLSRSVGIGQMLPLDPSKLMQPGAKAKDIISAEAESAAGAAYGVPISIFKAIMADEYAWDDYKRWEGAVPAALRNLARAWRYYQEGSERNAAGNLTMGFDGDDPEQLGEIIGVAMGFKPTRQTQKYDRETAIREIDQYWSTQKEMLMRQAYRDKFVYKDDEAYKSTLAQIREYNSRAIAPKYKISTDGLIESFKRRRTAGVKQQNGVNIPSQVNSMIDRLYPESVATQKVK